MATQYAQITDMQNRYDVRRLGDLVSDSDTRVTNLTGNSILNQMLKDASGLVDAACQRGDKYAALDLVNVMNGADPLNPTIDMTNSQALLQRIVCDLAYGLLLGRRGYSAADTDSQAPRYKEALGVLKLLEDGEWIFTTAGALAAGLPQTGIVISQQVGLLSSNTRYFGDLYVPPNNRSQSNIGHVGFSGGLGG